MLYSSNLCNDIQTRVSRPMSQQATLHMETSIWAFDSGPSALTISNHLSHFKPRLTLNR